MLKGELRMKKDVYFFYDESGHSRKITADTMNDEDFKCNFISAIVGIEKEFFSTFNNDYIAFENKWRTFFNADEIKSNLIKAKKYKFGLSSFKKDDVAFYSDLFDLILKNNVYLHFGIINKIEFLVNQMLSKSSLLKKIDFNSVSYSMAKSLCVYHPKEVLSSIEGNINEFLPKYKVFLEKRRKLNTRDNGESEEIAFKYLITIIDSINTNLDLEWNYVFSFDGFKKYILELNLNNAQLLIDKEGIGNTKNAAINDGLVNVMEEDSKKSAGIRCADLLAGFLGNMINICEIETSYMENDATRNESLLPVEWFKNLSKEAFILYKKAYKIFIDLNDSWYKYYVSLYADGFLVFLSLLIHLERYASYDEYKKDSDENHQRKVNTILYWKLKQNHEKINGNYKIESITPNDEVYFYNAKGAKCYYDYKKHTFLKLPNDGEELKYFVLSVGFFHINSNSSGQPCITISDCGKPICYLLPFELSDWVNECQINVAIFHNNVFPCFATFKNNKNKLKILLSQE